MFSTVKIVLPALVFALQVAVVYAHTPEPVPEVELHRPLDVPDRIVLTWTDDPATSQAVTWRTAARVDSAVAELTVATPHGGFGRREGMRDSAVTVLATTQNCRRIWARPATTPWSSKGFYPKRSMPIASATAPIGVSGFSFAQPAVSASRFPLSTLGMRSERLSRSGRA